ncbi:MAG: hypothetical protein J6W28_07760 [Clostridia bacterium]|nr:hypothetical protein [Clostridia bacterium]
MTRTTPLIRTGRLLLACIFLFTPNVSLFDLLPDFIGYALILSAIREASFVFPHFDAAYRGFRRMLLIGVAKIPASLLMLSIAGKNLDERSIVTVFSLSFAVLEILFLLPAFRSLWEGFLHIGEREGVSACLADGNGKSIDSLTLLTLIFLIVKHGMSTLPEMSLLSLFEKMGSLDPGAVNIAALYPLFAVFGAVIVLVFGILWLTRAWQFFSSLRADRAFASLLEEKAATHSESIAARADRREALTFLYLFLGAALFLIDPVMDDRDVLPNFFAALLFFLAFCYAKQEKTVLAGKILSGVYGFFAFGTFVAREIFYSEFEVIDVAFRDAALFRYIPVEIFTVLESLAFIALLFLLLPVLKHFTVDNTGKNLRETDLVLRNDIHFSLFKKIKGLSSLGILYAVFRSVEVFLLTIVDRHVITESEANQEYGVGEVVYSSLYGGSWFILLALGVALAAYVFFLVRSLREEMGDTEQ